MSNNKNTGDYGEELASKYLRKLGFNILERNFRIRGGEIDIIAEDQDCLVFVEVKTRLSHDFGPPAESITPWKIRFLIRASQFYLLEKDLGEVECRIDVVTVDFANSKDNPEIEHIKNITFDS